MHKQPRWLQLVDLLYMELLNWRWGWRPLVLTGILLPVTLIVLLRYVAGADAAASRYAHILTGNLTVALMFTNMRRMATRFAWLREAGTLDYYATLPVQRSLVVVAVLGAFFLLSLPALLITMGFSSFFLPVTLRVHPLLVGVGPLTALSLAGLGAYVGVAARTAEEAQTYSQALLFLFLALGPVLIPSANLPRWMQIAGWFNPATYGASALQQVLLGPITVRLWLDVGLLLSLAMLSLYFADRKLDWRHA